MSLLAHADLLKAYLDEVEDLAGVAVHVDRKFDVRDLATAALSQKTAGAFLAISLGGWTPMDADATSDSQYWATLRYEISLSTVPHILETLEMPTFDVLLARAVKAIHGWKPEGTNAAYCGNSRYAVGPGNYVPDDDFLVYLFPVSIEEDFHNPVAV